MIPAKAPPVRKVLPVLFLIDVSGSMSRNNKIDCVNNAIAEALEELDSNTATDPTQEVYVNVLKFGCNGESPCQWMNPEMQPLNVFEWTPLVAESNTPLGQAYFELDAKLSSSAFMSSPSGTFAPVIILITDGLPNNRKMAVEGLDRLRTNSWFVHAERMAIGVDIRENDDTSFLYEFVRGSENGMVFMEISNTTALIDRIRGIVINTMMIGATRLKSSDEYKKNLEEIKEAGPVEEPSVSPDPEPEAEEDPEEDGDVLEEPVPPKMKGSNEEEDP